MIDTKYVDWSSNTDDWFGTAHGDHSMTYTFDTKGNNIDCLELLPATVPFQTARKIS